MEGSDAAFSGSIPDNYDRYFVPMLFEPYAQDLAERVAHLTSGLARGSVLETAAGTGVVTRSLDWLLPPTTEIVSTDLNQAMLDTAAGRLSSSRVTWRQADALSLPFEDGSFDAVACQFGVTFFPDRVGGYAEAIRVLKPGGHFVFNVWDSIENNELAHAVSSAAAAMFPDDPPKFLERTPYGYSDIGVVERELTDAGFEDIKVQHLSLTSGAPSPRVAARGFCEGTPLLNEILARDPQGLESTIDAAATAIAKRFGNGPIEAGMSALVVTAASPDQRD